MIQFVQWVLIVSIFLFFSLTLSQLSYFGCPQYVFFFFSSWGLWNLRKIPFMSTWSWDFRVDFTCTLHWDESVFWTYSKTALDFSTVESIKPPWESDPMSKNVTDPNPPLGKKARPEFQIGLCVPSEPCLLSYWREQLVWFLSMYLNLPCTALNACYKPTCQNV